MPGSIHLNFRLGGLHEALLAQYPIGEAKLSRPQAGFSPADSAQIEVSKGMVSRKLESFELLYSSAIGGRSNAVISGSGPS